MQLLVGSKHGAIIIAPWLEASLQANIGNTMARFDNVYAIGYNSAEYEPIWMKSEALYYIVWDWPWQILGVIRAVARAGEPGEVLFFFVR